MSRIDNNKSLITYQQKFYNESKFRYSNRKQHKEHISRTPLKKLLIKIILQKGYNTYKPLSKNDFE